MRPLVVDVAGLDGFQAATAALATRLETPTAVVRTAVAGPPGRDPVLAADLTEVLRRCLAAVTAVRALAALVALVARRYTTVEQEVAASFGPGRPPAAAPPPDGDPLVLLTRLDPARLAALLAAAPALARTVVDAEAAGQPVPGLPGVDVAALIALVVASRGPRLAGRAAWLTAQRRLNETLTALGPRRLQLLALLRPGLVGSTSSAPLAARWSANRVLVAADLDRLLRRQSALPPGRALDRVVRQIGQRREWLDGTVTLRGPDGRERRRRHQLLQFDPRGDGQVVEMLGDPARARHLAVLVPGTGSDLERYPGTLARARALAAADPSVAMVVWQGADFPDQPFDDGVLPLREHVLAAAYRDAADVAGPRLAADVEGLRIAAPRAARDLTVLGHSYGAAIVGSAEANGMVADRVVYVAGAGTYAPPGAGTASNAEGSLTAHVTRRFAMTAYDDPIRLSQGRDLDDAAGRWRAMAPRVLAPAAPVVAEGLRVIAGDPQQIGLGPDPDLVPGVVRLDPGVFDDGRPVSGHSAMWTPGSTAWRNLLATTNGGEVSVLEPQRWASSLQRARITAGSGGIGIAWPRYVVDRTPWADPSYLPPTAATR